MVGILDGDRGVDQPGRSVGQGIEIVTLRARIAGGGSVQQVAQLVDQVSPTCVGKQRNQRQSAGASSVGERVGVRQRGPDDDGRHAAIGESFDGREGAL